MANIYQVEKWRIFTSFFLSPLKHFTMLIIILTWFSDKTHVFKDESCSAFMGFERSNLISILSSVQQWNCHERWHCHFGWQAKDPIIPTISQLPPMSQTEPRYYFLAAARLQMPIHRTILASSIYSEQTKVFHVFSQKMEFLRGEWKGIKVIMPKYCMHFPLLEGYVRHIMESNSF